MCSEWISWCFKHLSPSRRQRERHRQQQLAKLRRSLHKALYTGAWVLYTQACPHHDPHYSVSQEFFDYNVQYAGHNEELKKTNRDVFV
ncbi:hypothetical protein JTE90_028442 [Oedothorax gibbosus]|uniref:Uncharacterized protein n=1 Tax=Oedothorax gibbosus TaxID=931172 RepID=A0AAV6VGQ5_9ARAC|nr:hypothetical protein JTE90_028442 [Oedothorax gibbosus]